MRALCNLLLAIAMAAYPFAVYYGVRFGEPWQVAAVLLLLLVLRQSVAGRNLRYSGWLLAAGCIFGATAVWRNDWLTLRFYPVVVNAAMLLLFAWSLAKPPTVIERLARLQHPDLPAAGIKYTRQVTLVWCLFFLVNGSIAWVTAIWSSVEIWSLYNGLIAYLLMGMLFAGEYWVRRKIQPHAR